jgi:hypothetical protein
MNTMPVGPDGQPVSLPPQPIVTGAAPFPIRDEELIKYDGPGHLVAVVIKPIFNGTLEELEKLQAEEAAQAEAQAQAHQEAYEKAMADASA